VIFRTVDILNSVRQASYDTDLSLLGEYLDFCVFSNTDTQSLIRNPWDQTRFGNRNFSDFGIVVRGIRGQELSESIAQIISTDW
jgi:hypothetical protein